MPIERINIGPIQAVYAGVFGASSVALTQLPEITTEDQVIFYNIPETHLVVANNSVPSGPHAILTTITWISDFPEIVKLSMGNWITTTYQDDPSTFSKLSLFLLSPDEEGDGHIYIPECYVKKNLKFNRSKRSVSSVSLDFYFQHENHNKRLFYKRTLSQLQSIMGAMYPL